MPAQSCVATRPDLLRPSLTKQLGPRASRGVTFKPSHPGRESRGGPMRGNRAGSLSFFLAQQVTSDDDPLNLVRTFVDLKCFRVAQVPFECRSGDGPCVPRE